MDSEELQEIRECLTWQEGQPEIPVSAAASLGLALLAEVDRLRAENVALRARAVPKVEWRRKAGESAAKVGGCTLEVCRGHGDYGWYVHTGNSVPVMGRAHNRADGEAKAEAAFLRLVGVRE